ncbi:MAG: peptide chain release factor N(5)-glutamine methyltransferase [Desulfobacterium sp.]
MSGDHQRVWTLLNTVAWTASYFKDKGVDSPRLTAEILMCHCLGMDRVSLYMEFDRPLNPGELARYKTLIQRRVQREPVAYITGKKGFWDIEVAVSPHVLIPRPDTETLVETALSELTQFQQRTGKLPLNVLELGTGSGAVIISLARAMPGHHYFAVDVSPAAAEITLKNARSLECVPGLSVVTGSWFDPFGPQAAFDLIVSNPPYIPTRDIETLAPEIQNYEPRLALDGGIDGLDCIVEILSQAVAFLNPGGVLLMETGFDQKNAIEALVTSMPVYEYFQSIRDEAGHHRVVKIKKRIDKKT